MYLRGHSDMPISPLRFLSTAVYFSRHSAVAYSWDNNNTSIERKEERKKEGMKKQKSLKSNVVFWYWLLCERSELIINVVEWIHVSTFPLGENGLMWATRIHSRAQCALTWTHIFQLFFFWSSQRDILIWIRKVSWAMAAMQQPPQQEQQQKC